MLLHLQISGKQLMGLRFQHPSHSVSVLVTNIHHRSNGHLKYVLVTYSKSGIQFVNLCCDSLGWELGYNTGNVSLVTGQSPEYCSFQIYRKSASNTSHNVPHVI